MCSTYQSNYENEAERNGTTANDAKSCDQHSSLPKESRPINEKK